jgi:glycosyltransferase 2 family protein
MFCWVTRAGTVISRARARPVEGRRLSLLRGVIGVAVAIAVLIATGLHVDGNHVSVPEEDVFRILNGLPDFLYWPAWAIMQFGNLIAVPAVAIAALVFRRYRLVIACALVGVGKWYTSRLLKDVFLRERPASVLSDVVLRDAPATGQAFVSGHAVIAVGLAVVLHPYLGRKGRIVLWAAAALVCVARVYVGAHLPLDVVGGAAAGWAIGSIAHLLSNVGRRRSTSF